MYRPVAVVPPPVVVNQPPPPVEVEDETGDAQADPARAVGWLDRLVLAAAVAAVLFALVYFGALWLDRPMLPPLPTSAPVASAPTATRTATVTSTPRPASPTATPVPRPSQSATVAAGGRIRTLNPLISDVGWITNGDRQGVHVSDRSIQAGVFDGAVYMGLVQFDLSELPADATVQAAALELTGARDVQAGSAGAWTIKLITLPAGARLDTFSFDEVRALKWDFVLQPALNAGQLGAGKVNRFELTGPVLETLQRAAGQGRVLFRIDGPTSGPDDIFAWESGTGAGAAKPSLIVSSSAGADVASKVVVIACVPTPDDPAARAALEATATYAAQSFGTPTPYPPYYVTPIVVTATPTPATVFAAATAVAQATLQAAEVGTATPTPVNWVVPPIITATPAPANQATAVYQTALATAIAATTGTPTPLPCYVSIVPYGTPTPPLVVYNLPTPTPTPAPTRTPASIPAAVRGTIAFMSDRDGAPAVFVMDPDGSRVGRLSDRWAYDVTGARQAQAGLNRLAVIGQPTTLTRIELVDLGSQRTRVLVQNDGINYDPAFAPNGYDFVYVSTVTGHDEIYRLNLDLGGSQQLTHSDWEWNKRPSWSSDGKQIVFWSNRVTGRKQLWRMNADGGDLTNISRNAYNDWDPVWIH
ncbi:MAG: PD40 domain-containing protein [Chloroflexi bacterium]|nr:PD40 domain-containing protein [Chloroflexota bacterium]